MEIPKLDRRDRRDFLQQLRDLASRYVPEWRWDDREPDAGVVLAHIYANMMENTVSRYNRSMYNHYLSFLNLLGTRLMPSSPAEGTVTVQVIPGTPGVDIPKGTSVYAAADNSTGRVFYDTTEAVHAVDSEVDQVFFTSAARDSIVSAWKRGPNAGSFRLFGFDLYPELQKHMLFFRDDAVFYSKERTDLRLSITHSRSQKNTRYLADFFSDPESVTWSCYSAEKKWEPFDSVTLEDGQIHLQADQGNTPVETAPDETMGLIRCQLHRIPPRGLYLTDISWTAEGRELPPDHLASSNSELPEERFSPFGDILSLFTEFSLSSREAFFKAGAMIDIDFDLEFFRTPIEAAAMPDTTIYRSIMAPDDFPVITERDVKIERVLWEYWNGLGWARLFPSGANEDFFTPGKAKPGVKRLSFRCPDDMTDLVLSAFRGPFIRARIDKLSYMTLTTGNYISPFVRNVKISYHYEPEHAVVARNFAMESNVERRLVELPNPGNEPFVTASLCPDPAAYLCLTGPLEGGPLRIFFDIAEGVFPDPPSLRWEYYGRSANGDPAWKNIEVMDLTNSLTRSAILTLVGKRDFVRASFFGAEGYFLRIVDGDRRYDTADWRTTPEIRNIWLNTVPVIQRERRQPEFFYIARGEQNKRCKLSVPNLSSARVWVNEQNTLSVREEEELLRSPDVQVQRSAEGTITEIWVPWHEVDRMEAAGPDERAFLVDYSESSIVFGDGRHGKIPPDRAEESIRIEYVVCDGTYGNVPPRGILGFASKPNGAASVTNFRRICGGTGMETIDQAADRTSGELSGMGRIVTLEDFQRAVLASNRSIHRVKIVPHVDRYNRRMEGHMAVAVLPREFRQGTEVFTAVARNAKQLIRDKSSLLLSGDRVDVFEVRYVEISVSAEIVISDYNLYHEVHQAVVHRLEEFLNPITGNFNGQGWDIGQIPSRELIYNSIKTIKNIKWVRALHVFHCMVTDRGLQPVEPREIRKDAFAVPVFGEPEITLSIG